MANKADERSHPYAYNLRLAAAKKESWEQIPYTAADAVIHAKEFDCMVVEIQEYKSQLAATTAKLENAEAELEALREKLPVTADEVSVVPMTDPVFLMLNGALPTTMNVWANGNCSPQANTKLGVWSVSQCYSTPEAALAARTTEGVE